MEKERIMAIFIGLTMVLSLLGFALMATSRYGQGSQNSMIMPHVVDRVLTNEEVSYVLQTGRVLIENYYELNCTQCLERNVLLESFVNQYNTFAVLQSVAGNETSLKLIGRGRIRDLTNESITQETLMEVFCEVAITQPRECLLEEI
jgi:hypothetical protein